MMVLVIDGQGGRLGKLIIEKLKKRAPGVDVTAIGTNSLASSAMLKAGADQAASGQNPVVYNSKRADVIIGPVGIVIANALLGEITPAMANAVSESDAYKILLPVNRCNHFIVGIEEHSMAEYIELAVDEVLNYLHKGN